VGGQDLLVRGVGWGPLVLACPGWRLSRKVTTLYIQKSERRLMVFDGVL
jgi:hypothetical protein